MGCWKLYNGSLEAWRCRSLTTRLVSNEADTGETDKIKRLARTEAWYDRDGEKKSWNPFKKTSRTYRPKAGSDPEEGFVTDRSASPIVGTNVDGTAEDDEKVMSNGHSRSGPSTSSDPTIVPSRQSQKAPSVEQKARSRFVSMLHRKKGEPELERTESAEHKRKKSGFSITPRKHKPFTLRNQLGATIFNSWINVLLIAAPVGIAVNYVHIAPVAIFVINFIAIIPLAALLSFATEEIALRVGETLGGLLNASFGYVRDTRRWDDDTY